MENNEKYYFKDEGDNINLNLDSFKLYLNSVGGHSLFIEISKKYLIKSSNQNEINFYCFIQQNKENFRKETIPHFKGVIRQNTKNFDLIVNYVNQCKTFFRNYLKENKIKSSDIELEKDSKFNEIFKSFLKEKDIFLLKDLNPSFKKLKEKLKTFSKDKLNWILFSFVKWRENFLKNEFIILENLTYDMEDPAILDIKLGSAIKISKENQKVKIYKGASNEIGCRIMGIQKGEIFKNRYFTRNFTVQEFKKSIFEFFINRKEFVEKTYKEIQFLIKEVEKFDMEFKYSSLLIAYDDKNLKNVNNYEIHLIDFSFYEKGSEIDNTSINLITSIKHFLEILDEMRK